MTSYSLTLTESKVIEIQKLLKNHSLYEILDNIHTSLDEREADDYGELGSWGSPSSVSQTPMNVEGRP